MDFFLSVQLHFTIGRKKYYLISNLTDCLKRLDGENLLGVETANSIRRKAFTKEAEAILRESLRKDTSKIAYESFFNAFRHIKLAFSTPNRYSPSNHFKQSVRS